MGGCLLALSFSGCSSAPKKTPELSRLEGQKVALLDIDGEETARKVIEVALVNQLVNQGSFELVNKKEVDYARALPDVKPGDWRTLTERSGAAYGLRAKVLKFDANTREGYSSEEVYDSQLAQERGEKEGKTQRLYKVKAMTGEVQIELQFTEVRTGDVRAGIAEAKETITAEAKDSAAHLPPKLRFLEELTNQAFKLFFDKYQ